jgi:hypothetical protein
LLGKALDRSGVLVASWAFTVPRTVADSRQATGVSRLGLGENVKLTLSDYRIQRGSDIQRNGMFLELIDTKSEDCVAEVFYHDGSGKISISIYAKEAPLEAIAYLVRQARHVLPSEPQNKNGE